MCVRVYFFKRDRGVCVCGVASTLLASAKLDLESAGYLIVPDGRNAISVGTSFSGSVPLNEWNCDVTGIDVEEVMTRAYVYIWSNAPI